MKIKRIIFCTLRNNKLATGGPGGVLYLQKSIIGNHIVGIPCKYQFNMISKGFGRYRDLLKKILFYLKFCITKNAYFFTHDVYTGYILYKLGKRYSLLFHQQGPILQELSNFGMRVRKKQVEKLKKIERIAFMNAETLHFPSNGATNMYFDSSYASCTRNEVNLSFPLYNVIPQENISINKYPQIEKDESVITFFSLGTLTLAKGQDQTIKFIEYFLSAQKNPVRYIMVGNGPLKDLLIQELERMKYEYPFFSYIYLESVPHDVVMYLHYISDIYIMLHRISIFDFATLEAMSQGTAIILSKVGGNIDFNKEENILFVEDIQSNFALLKKNTLDTYKRLNLQVFRHYFSKTAFVNQYVKLFNSLK